MRMPERRKLVLLGAGHAHVEVLRRFAGRGSAGLDVTLIAREPRTPYSGMLPGLLRGDYCDEDIHVDCAPLANAAGAHLVIGEARSLDMSANRVQVAGHAPIDFDLLSINVGGIPDMPGGDGIPVKPIGQLLEQLGTLKGSLPRGAHIAVIGGGLGGVELALALAARGAWRLTLIAAPPFLPQAPPRARATLVSALDRADIAVVEGTAVAAADGCVQLAEGPCISCSASLWATGVRAPAFLARSGLGCDPSGCVETGATLQSLTNPHVFAAGDCAAFSPEPRPKAGVWAVRAGPILARNLLRAARGEPPRHWRPQRRALVIVGLGHGRAVAWRGSFSVSGQLAWRWKDAIDRRWVARYRGFS